MQILKRKIEETLRQWQKSADKTTKDYDTALRNKIARFQLETKTPKTIRLVLITALGLKKNIYSNIVQNSLTVNDLFKDI